MANNSLALGGFENLKQWLMRAKVGFSQQAQALNLAPPKGIMIVGIQGCGKSLAAKAIAREWQMPLLKLDAGRLYDKYIGESEKNFRQAIKLSESMSPTILWIDEIEKSFGSSNNEADGGLSRRLFGSFLTWMQEKSQEVFVVATANDISNLPPELLRKGRFDEIFFVDLPDEPERATIWKIHLALRKQTPEQFNLSELVATTAGFSGAEIEQSLISALYHALYLNQPLDTALLLQSVRSLIPLSVSRREDLEQLRAIAQERFVSVR
jgi:SpoVK/Ycf46/Vps4 family AAA+-type ATPase